MRLPHVLLRYGFDDEPHPVTSTAHGNVKKSNSSYYRSRPSMLQSIKEKQKHERGLLKCTTKYSRMQEACSDSNHMETCQGIDNKSVMLDETRSRKKTKMKCVS